MISQVNYYTASTCFFEQTSALLPHVKRMITDMPWGKVPSDDKSKKQGDHEYAFPSTSTANKESNADESYVDI